MKYKAEITVTGGCQRTIEAEDGYAAMDAIKNYVKERYKGDWSRIDIALREIADLNGKGTVPAPGPAA